MFVFGKSGRPVARKEHRCDLCGGAIKPGEQYVRRTGLYDDRFWDEKFHLNCLELIGRYCKDLDADEYTEDAVIDWLYDRVCTDCIHGNEDNIWYTPCPYNTPCECPKVYELTEVKLCEND